MRISRPVPAPCDRAAIQYTIPGGTIRRRERRLPCACCRGKSAGNEGTVEPDTTISCMPIAPGPALSTDRSMVFARPKISLPGAAAPCEVSAPGREGDDYARDGPKRPRGDRRRPRRTALLVLPCGWAA